MIFTSLSMLFGLCSLWANGSAVPVNAYEKTQSYRSVDMSITLPTTSFSSPLTFRVVEVLDSATNNVNYIDMLNIAYDTTNQNWHYSYNVGKSNIIMWFELLGSGSSTGTFVTTYTSKINYDYFFQTLSDISFTAHTSSDFAYTKINAHFDIVPEDIYNSKENYSDGYSDGYKVGYDTGYNEGDTNGYDEGYDEGYAIGIQEGIETGHITEIFANIMQFGMLPINFFLQVLNIEVFGINLGAFVSGLLTIAIIIIILRLILGSSSGGGK